MLPGGCDADTDTVLSAARHVVEKESDIKSAMEFLQQCQLLKIEDILPFFPDFVTIDHFKVNKELFSWHCYWWTPSCKWARFCCFCDVSYSWLN